MSKIKSTAKGTFRKTRKSIPSVVATPNHVCLRNYEEGEIIKELIELTNHDVKCYHLSIEFDNTEDLKLSIIGDETKTFLDFNETLVLELEFTAKSSFKKASVDRRFDICVNIINGNANLHVPILVLSSNPVVNFPKEISLPDIAINSPAYSNIFVLNYTNHFYKFSFESRSEVKILPDCKVIALKPGDGTVYTVELIPKLLGPFREKIHICFDSGKKISVILKCNVIPLSIFLSDEIINFTPTYIGMMETKSISIINNSEEMTLFELLPTECLHNNSQCESTHPSKKFLQLSPPNGELLPNSITKVYIVFKPQDPNDDDPEKDISKEISFTFALKLSFDTNYHPTFEIHGKILGPSFQLDQRHILIDTMYLGEHRYFDVKVINTGIIEGKVFFHKTPSSSDGIIKISSKSEVIPVTESRTFKLKFLAKSNGKFIEQAFFKVKNGERLSLAIEGIIKPLELYYHPRAIDFPPSSICVPQVRSLLVKNELPFDVYVNMEIESNGSDNPLEFIEFFKSQISTIDSISNHDDEASPSKSSLESQQSSIISSSSHLTRTSIKQFMEQSGNLEHLRDMTRTDGIATIFNKVNDIVASKEIAESIIQNLFDGSRFNFESEKLHIVEMMLEVIIEKVHEAEFSTIGFQRFHEKAWQVPESPRQIVCDQNSFRVAPKESIEVKIFLTPNSIGKFTRSLKLLVEMSTDVKSNVDKTLINVPITYYCETAQLKILEQTKEIECFAENEIQVEIPIENVSTFDGFFSVEKLHDAEMEVRCDEEKFHMPPTSKKSLKLIITPFKSGEILKHVHIIALGSNKKFPIYIDCKSLPPNVVIKPGRICEQELEVLVKHDTRIFIENRSETKARFFLKLEHDRECFTINPRGGILSSNQCVMVILEKFFHDPGDYRDVLIVEVVNSKIFKIPIKCIAKKLPILIAPSFAPVIDFGSLFVSKTPYFLEYKFTNGGKHTYMLFVLLKNWKNRQEIRYTIEPNRFELSSNESRVVKFLLNAEHPLTIEEDFTIEGCSSIFPLREVIWESKLKVNVIKPTINFTRNELIFNCFYGRAGDLCERVEIINKSALALPITLKIEGEFFTNDELKFDMKIKESREIEMKFASKLLNTSSIFCTFHGKLKAFALGRLQCTLNLIGNLIYPEIDISTRVLNVTSNLLPCAFSFKLRNPSDTLSSSFELKFKETGMTEIEEKRQPSLMNIVQCLMLQKCNLKDKFFLPDCIEEVEEIEDFKISSTSTATTETIAKNYNIEATSKDLQKCFKSLMRTVSETQCSDSNNEKITKVNLSSSFHTNGESFLSLSQYKGILKPGESRLISIFFNGSRNAFNLTSKLLCETLGGACQEISINLINCNSNILVTKTYFEITQPWHEITTNNVTVSSISPSSINIKLIGAEKNDVEVEELMEGYVKHSSKSPMDFVLDNERNFCGNLKFSIFCGCQVIFRNEFAIQVNDKAPYPVSFYARNSMPMATLLDIDRNSLFDMEKSFEYDCMCEMFNKIVDRIRVHEEEINVDEMLKAKLATEAIDMTASSKLRKKSIKRDKKRSIQLNTDNISAAGDSEASPKEFGLCYGDNGRVSWREKSQSHPAKILQLLDKELDFTVLDYPCEYPKSTEITSFIAQRGFVKSLDADDEIFIAYKNLYNRCVVEKFRQAKKSVNSDDSFVTPLPLVVHEYALDFGQLEIDEEFERVIEIYYHGEKLMAAVRSEAIIPDFKVKFLQSSEINGFSITNYEKEVTCKYQNRLQRQLSEQNSSFEVKRCHSFDFNTGKVHGRTVTTDRNEINRIYNEKMATRVKTDEKSPFILTEIFQQQLATDNCVESKIIEIKIKFSPKIENYDDETSFDEIIYVDLHLGPQIPLHITGKIVHGNFD